GHPLASPHETMHQKPVGIFPVDGKVYVLPDHGNWTAGFWEFDPDTGDTRIVWELPTGESCTAQLGIGSQVGNPDPDTWYVTFADYFSGSNRTYVVAT